MPRITVKKQLEKNKHVSRRKLDSTSLRYKYKNQISKKLMRTRYKVVNEELKKRNIKLRNVIDRGAFGVVYRAGVKYAVKMTRSYLEYISVKKIIEKNIKHENMVNYIDAFAINEDSPNIRLYIIVMELVTGRDQCCSLEPFRGFAKKREQLKYDMDKHGLELSCDAHSGNVGIKNGTLKFFDIF